MPYDVNIEILKPYGLLDVRGKDDVRRIYNNILGITLPTTANTLNYNSSILVFCISPDHWLVRVPDGEEIILSNRLGQETDSLFKAVTVVSDNYVIFQISGHESQEVLMQGVSIDLHPYEFTPPCCARTSLAKTTALLYKKDEEPSYEIYVYRSYYAYVKQWLDYVIGL